MVWETSNTHGLKIYYQACLAEAIKEHDTKKVKQYQNLIQSMEPKKEEEE